MNQNNTNPPNHPPSGVSQIEQNEDPVAALIDCCVCYVNSEIIESSVYSDKFNCLCRPSICVVCFSMITKCIYCKNVEIVAPPSNQPPYIISDESFELLQYVGQGIGLALNDGVIINASILHNVCGEHRVYLYRHHVILNYKWEDALHLSDADQLYFHDWCNQMFTLGASADPLVRIALNGNNGSWTNTDDHDHDQDKKRNIRVKETNKHRTQTDQRDPFTDKRKEKTKNSKKTNRKGWVTNKSDNSSGSTSPTDDDSSFEEVAPTLPTRFYITSKDLDLLYDYEEKRSFNKNDSILLLEGDTWCNNLILNEYGLATILEGKGVSALTKAPFSNMIIKSYRYMDENNCVQWKKEVSGVICHPLYEELRQIMKHIDPSKTFDRIMSSCWSISLKYFVPESIIKHTVEYTLALSIQRNNHKRIVINSLISFDRNSFLPSDDVNLSNNEGMLRTESIVRDYAKVCDIPNRYEIRDDIHIPDAVGVPFYDKYMYRQQTLFTIPTEYDEKEYISKYFSFNPQNVSGFQSYGKHPTNLSLGLRRVIGARDHENVYRDAQRHLLSHFLDDQYSTMNIRNVTHYQKIQETLKINFNHLNKNLTFGSTAGGEDVQVFDIRNYNDSNLYHSLVLPYESYSLTQKVTPKIVKHLNQYIARSDRCGMTRFLDSLQQSTHWLYNSILENFYHVGSAFELRQAVANLQHVKKRLRRQYVANHILHTDDCSLMTTLELQIKRELAKFGKVPRIYASYGAGCMSSPELPEFIKTCIDGHYYLDGRITTNIQILAKPRPDSLKEIFDECVASTKARNHLYICIYSDDSVVCGNINDVPICFNLDISSCDASNMHLIFTVVGKMLSQFNSKRANALLKQCMKTMYYRNPCDKKDVKKINMFRPFEGSGTVLTTILNHTASYLMACSIHECLNELYTELVSDSAILDAVKLACSIVGYKITCESCKINGLLVYEKIQFLKYSPMFTATGDIIPTLNYGAIFRSLGHVDQNMTPEQLGVSSLHFSQMPPIERMDRFFTSVVQGHCHQPGSCIMDALRSRFNVNNIPGQAESRSRLVIEKDGSFFRDIFTCDESENYITTDSICNRYDCTIDELQDLLKVIDCIDLGDHCFLPIFNKIFGADYGLC